MYRVSGLFGVPFYMTETGRLWGCKAQGLGFRFYFYGGACSVSGFRNFGFWSFHALKELGFICCRPLQLLISSVQGSAQSQLVAV